MVGAGRLSSAALAHDSATSSKPGRQGSAKGKEGIILDLVSFQGRAQFYVLTSRTQRIIGEVGVGTRKARGFPGLLAGCGSMCTEGRRAQGGGLRREHISVVFEQHSSF